MSSFRLRLIRRIAREVENLVDIPFFVVLLLCILLHFSMSLCCSTPYSSILPFSQLYPLPHVIDQ